MIPLVRVRDAKTIKSVFRGATRKKRLEALLDDFYSRKGALDSKYWKSSFWKPAKDQLKAESRGKCAYCEAATTAVAHGDVEHFRPKSLYWWLAYCYDNYLFSCQICNQTYKGDRFPVTTRWRSPAPRTRPAKAKAPTIAHALAPDPLEPVAVAAHATRARKEGAYLVDPYTFDPAMVFAWEADATLKEVKLVPLGKTAGARRAVESAEELLGLNREELRRLRYHTFDQLDLCRRLLERKKQADREEVMALVKRMIADDAPFAGMARYFAKKWKLG